MNKEQQQIIDKVYQNYRKVEFERIMSQNHGEYLMGKEELINKCNTDTEFSEKWGLKIEERELSDDERYDLCAAQKSKMSAISEEDYIKYNIPTRLITVTYKEQTIESYE